MATPAGSSVERFFRKTVSPFFLLTGAGMAAAIVPAWRLPIFIYSGIEKAFMVWLVLSNADQPFVSGFWVPCALDSTVVLYTIGYFAACGFRRTSVP